ncbi:MAG: 50S ribosomal protein L6 [Elusimicrobia bacterium]|nr:50S ribosomal protein L6 [Elusimicrobiota bacterium]
MSRLGKRPVGLPEKVKAEFKNGVLTVEGPGGKLQQVINERINLKIDAKEVLVEKTGETKQHNVFQGLTRGLIMNMVEGVTAGFKKELEMHGLGYKAVLEGKNLTMNVGYSHTVSTDVPEGIKVAISQTSDKIPVLTITGINKELVGAFSAKLRAFKKPEPYKGFGIRYAGEKIIRKAGKSAAGAGKK